MRLVRFQAVFLPRDQKQEETEDRLIFDTFIDDRGRICNAMEMLGKQVTFVGVERQKRLDFLSLNPDLSIHYYEDAYDPHMKTVHQNLMVGKVSEDIIVQVGATFNLSYDDLYECEIVEVIEINGGSQ